ncbi:MAG: hypothetical protein JSR82_13985 [Verrucomicrobia bacterium]|nr:hypothetical protein [Verrucomicrobiota bacterium]
MTSSSQQHSITHAQGDLGERTLRLTASSPLSSEEWEQIVRALGQPRYTVTEDGEVMPLALNGDFPQMLSQARELALNWKDQPVAEPR